jgi:hypothetical protein
MPKIVVELTKPQAEAAMKALDSYLGAASDQEARDFYGSFAAVQAAGRAHDAIAAATYGRGRRTS